MAERNRQSQTDRNPSSDNLTSKGKGMQGIDKAPGEEPAQDKEQVTWETLRGKGKNDGDPSKESDQPIDQ